MAYPQHFPGLTKSELSGSRMGCLQNFGLSKSEISAKGSQLFRLRYLFFLVTLSILQGCLIGPSIQYIVNSFFAANHSDHPVDCEAHPKSAPCRQGAVDSAFYHGWADSISAVLATGLALHLGSYSDVVGRRPLVIISGLLSVIPTVALAMNVTMQFTLWLYLIAVPVVGAFEVNGVFLALMSDLLPEPEERAAGFGMFIAVLMLLACFSMPLGYILPRQPAVVGSLVFAALKIAYLLMVFPETLSPEAKLAAASKQGRSQSLAGFLSTVKCSFQILTRNSYISRMACLLSLSGLGGAGYGICMGPFMTGYLGFSRIDQLYLGVASFASIIFTFLFVSPVLTTRLGEMRTLQVGLTANVAFPLCIARCSAVWHLVVCGFVLSGPIFLQIPVISAIKSNLVGKDEQGLMQGTIAAIGRTTSAVGFLAFGGLYKYVTQGGKSRSELEIGSSICFLIISCFSFTSLMIACSLPSNLTQLISVKNESLATGLLLATEEGDTEAKAALTDDDHGNSYLEEKSPKFLGA